MTKEKILLLLEVNGECRECRIGVCHLIVRTLFWRIRSDQNVHLRFFVNAKHEALEDSCFFQKMCLVCGPWTCMFLERDEIAKKNA